MSSSGQETGRVESMPAVRPARQDDLAALVRIYNHYIAHSIATFDTEPTTIESRLPWFNTFSEVGPHQLLVATAGDRVLGYASSSPYRTHPAFSQTVELSAYVDPDARANGIGSALYRALVGALRTQSVHVALAAIALPNDASVALHRRFGFAEVGTFDEYATKNSAYISSVWMQLHL
jgi:phosphinothricin acetyltransferase